MITDDSERSKKPSVRQLLFDNLLTVDELAADLSYAKSSIHRWVRQGMPSRKVRGRLYFDPGEVAQWMQRTTKR